MRLERGRGIVGGAPAGSAAGGGGPSAEEPQTKLPETPAPRRSRPRATVTAGAVGRATLRASRPDLRARVRSALPRLLPDSPTAARLLRALALELGVSPREPRLAAALRGELGRLRPDPGLGPRAEEMLAALCREERAHPVAELVEAELAKRPGGQRGDCGCFVHVGPSQAEGGLDGTAVALEAAERLEPRGYDSMQIGAQVRGSDGFGYDARKTLGDAAGLRRQMDGHPLPDASVQLVHLRWPTERRPSIDNQHPTILRDGQAAPAELELVFNGVIDNFREVDRFLAEQGVFRPRGVETDAWTMSALVHWYHGQPEEAAVEGRVAALAQDPRCLAWGPEALRAQAAHELKDEGSHRDLLAAVQAALPRLRGDFALIAISEREPGRAVAAKVGQKPLVVGLGNRPEVGNFVASDASAFVRWTDRVQNLRSGDVVLVEKEPARAAIFHPDQAGRLGPVPERERPVVRLDADEVLADRSLLFAGQRRAFDSFTEKEVFEGPLAIRRTLNHQDRLGIVRGLAAGKGGALPGLRLSAEELRAFSGITLYGMGTASLASGSALASLRENAGGWSGDLDVRVEVATETYDQLRRAILGELERAGVKLTREGTPHNPQGWADLVRAHVGPGAALERMARPFRARLGVAVSQSGNTQDTNQLVLLLQAFGMRFVGIVNKPIDTPLVLLTQGDGGVLRTKAGPEVGVASTKAYMAQLAMIELLGLYLGLVRGSISPVAALTRLDALEELPDQLEAYLADPALHAQTRRLGERLARERTLLYGGRGGMVPVAAEGALKMMELSTIMVKELDLAALKHGPIAVFPNRQQLGVAVLTDRVTEEEARGNLSEISARFGQMICVARPDQRELIADRALDVLVVPPVSDAALPLASVIPLQLLALETTKAIDRVSQRVSLAAEALYDAHRAGQGGGALDALRAELDRLRGEGALACLDPSRVDEVEAQAARVARGRGAGALELVQLLRGARLRLVTFFERRDLPLDERERAQVGQLFADFDRRKAPLAERMEQLERGLMRVLSGLLGRGGKVSALYSAHCEAKGLAEQLARNLDKPSGLAKEVTV